MTCLEVNWVLTAVVFGFNPNPLIMIFIPTAKSGGLLFDLLLNSAGHLQQMNELVLK
jgi:hypothetical protein